MKKAYWVGLINVKNHKEYKKLSVPNIILEWPPNPSIIEKK